MRIFKKSSLFLAIILFLFALSFIKTAIAQEIVLNDLNANPVNLSSFQGKPAILFFWTTWCPYCRKELKILNQMYPQIKNEGIVVFAINVGEADYKVKNFFGDYALNFKVLLDKDGRLADKYNIAGVPTYIFLDRSGAPVSQDNVLRADYKSLLLGGVVK